MYGEWTDGGKEGRGGGGMYWRAMLGMGGGVEWGTEAETGGRAGEAERSECVDTRCVPSPLARSHGH
jgi:hypothetical protein